MIKWLERAVEKPGVVALGVSLLALASMYAGLEHGQVLGHWLFR